MGGYKKENWLINVQKCFDSVEKIKQGGNWVFTLI